MMKLLLLSVAIHFTSALLSEFFVGEAQPTIPPSVKVSLIKTKILPNEDLLAGTIVDTPKPETEEKPDEADILAAFDSRAHTPKLAEKVLDDKEALPMKRKIPNERKAKYDPEKRPATTKKAEPVENPPSQKDENIITASLTDKFNEAESRPEERENPESRRIEFKREIERTSPTPPPPTEEIPKNQPLREEPQKGKLVMDGDEIDFFIRNNPHETLDMGDEAVVSLNTTKFEYIGYFSRIKRALEAVWAYPDEAIINGLSGSSLLRFTLGDDGLIQEVKLINSSGETVLDDASTMAITSAGPFEPFPQTLNKTRIHIVATFTYQPSFNSVR